MKRYAYIGLAILLAVSLTQRVRNSHHGWNRMVHHSELVRDPLDVSEPFTTIVFVQPEAQAAGIQRGDVLVGVDGQPFTGAPVLHVPLNRARVGDRLTFRVQSGAEVRDATVQLQALDKTPPTTQRWVVFIVNDVAMPLLCLFLGFWVAAVRIRDRQAWILLLMMVSFAEQGGPLFGRAALGYDDFFRYISMPYQEVMRWLWGISMLLFGIHFPERLTLDKRWPWAKWILVGPLLFRGVQSGLADFLQVNHLSWAQSMTSPFLPYDIVFIVLQMVAIGCFFSATGWKTGTLSNPDAKRRLLLLHAGATVSLSPIFILLVTDLVLGRPQFVSYPTWLISTVFILLFGFPLTMAYVIVVHRAMDVRVVVRQGMQYLFATGGIRALQIVLSAVIILSVGLMSTEDASRPERIRLIAIGVFGVFMIQFVAKRAKAWIDRRFFREAYNSEQILSDLAENVRTIVETDPLLRTVAQRISESLHVSRVAVLLRGGGTYRLAYAFGYANPPDVAFAEESSIIQRLRKESHARVYTDDSESWVHRTPETEKVALQQLEAQLLLPLSLNQKILGVLSLGPKRSEEPYSRSDLRLLGYVATQTGLALENSRLTSEIASEVAQRERMNREIEIAREVQERLFPQELQPVAGLDYAGACRPALGVGGDYYDFLTLQDHKLGVAIGDVAGKGIPAALLMASLRASLRGQTIQGGDDLAALMSNVNKLVYESSSSNRYATFFYAQYDPQTRACSYVNAGHNPPLVFRGDEVIRLEVGGPVVGLLPMFVYEQATIVLNPGDILVAFTDGISEAMNAADEEWGEDRLIECVRRAGRIAAQDLIVHTVAAADAFVAGHKQHDDMTIIVARVI